MPELLDIRDLVDEYVICRTIGHSWDDNPSGTVDSELFRAATAVLCLRCTRCTMERFDYINESMAVFQRYYRTPPMYNTIRGQGKRPNLRGEMVKRSLLVRTYKPKNASKAANKVLATV